MYLLIGAGLGAIAAIVFDSAPLGAIVSSMILLNVAFIWILYVIVLWFFKREAHQTVEITDSGVIEMVDGRQRQFLPWAGITEIEFNATLLAGASIRIRGNFADLTISNQDLMVTRPMTIRAMHAALGQLGPIRDLLSKIRANAPNASVRFNKLARRRYKETGV